MRNIDGKRTYSQSELSAIDEAVQNSDPASDGYSNPTAYRILNNSDGSHTVYSVGVAPNGGYTGEHGQIVNFIDVADSRENQS